MLTCYRDADHSLALVESNKHAYGTAAQPSGYKHAYADARNGKFYSARLRAHSERADLNNFKSAGNSLVR